MLHAERADARTNAPGRVVIAVAALVLVVAGCSSSGGRKLTAADLSKAMPTAQDIGGGFHRDKAAEADNNTDTKLQVAQKCRALLNDDDTGKTKAKREFKDTKDRDLTVSATVTDKKFATVQQSAKDCTRVPFTSGSTKGVITLKVTSSKGVGDDTFAVDLTLAVTEPISVSLKGYGVIAKRGDVGMSVLGLGGIDGQGSVTPLDHAIVDKAARDLDQKIKDA